VCNRFLLLQGGLRPLHVAFNFLYTFLCLIRDGSFFLHWLGYYFSHEDMLILQDRLRLHTFGKRYDWDTMDEKCIFKVGALTAKERYEVGEEGHLETRE